MRRIDPREAAVEGVVTRHGTLVGPVMTELAGFPELTPYGGGWCGNEVGSEFFSDHHRELARRYTQQMGDRLRQEGYRGYFELDFLVDAVSGELYLGELNPRVTGASSMTNVTAVAYGDMPLFLFHLLEYMDVEYEIDVDELNTRWARAQNVDAWSQFILKQVEDDVELHRRGAAVGHLADGRQRLDHLRPPRHRLAHGVDEREAFYLRIADAGGYRYPGADLGIIVTRGRFMDDDHELGDRARGWIEGIKGQFRSVPVENPAEAEIPHLSPSASRCCESLSVVFDRGRVHSLHVPRVRRARAGPALARLLRGVVARLPAVVPEGGRRRPAQLRDRAAHAAHLHARAGRRLRPARRPGRRRRRGRPDAVAVQASRRTWRAARRRPSPGPPRCWCATTTTRRRGSRASCRRPPGASTA